MTDDMNALRAEMAELQAQLLAQRDAHRADVADLREQLRWRTRRSPFTPAQRAAVLRLVVLPRLAGGR